MPTLAPGSQLGPYRVEAAIGRGGMGEVYRAVDQRLGRTVALKVLPADLAADPDRRKRLEREARIISNVSHPNICTLFDIGQDDDVWFLVMEHLEGETLEARLARGPLPVDEASQLAGGIAEALALAHSRGIVHRDLKPGNIMLTPDGVKILDFGLAKAWLATVWPGAAPASGTDGTETLTVEGTVLGTPPYMSPEQLNGQDVTAASDIFSFGSVLFEMVTGRRAFPGSTPAESVAKVLSERRPSLSDSAVGVPPALDRVVSRCLAQSPDDRWPTMRAVADTLREITATSARRLNQKASRWRPGRATVAVSVIALAGSVALIQWLQQAGTEPGVATPPVAATTAADTTSIAVLPFANDTGNAALDTVVEGIVLTVIDRLSQTNLRVTSLSSAGRYGGVEADPEVVATALGVEWLVIGRVLATGGRLTAIVELVNPDGTDPRRAQTDSWTGADDPLVSRDIAQAILEVLAVPADVGGPETTSPQAAGWYREGRSALDRRDLRRAIQLFMMAKDEDPNFALAWAGLASAHALLGTMGWDGGSPAVVVPLAKEFARKALDLDAGVAEAHAAYAFVLRFERQREQAAARHRLSIDLNQSCATCYQWLASHLWTQNRFNEARTHLDEALELDPESAVIHLNLGRHYYYQREYELAIPHFEDALDLDPDFWLAGQLIILSRVQLGDLTAARAAFDDLLGAPPLNHDVIDTYLLAVEGRTAEAEAGLARLLQAAENVYLPVYLFAPIHAALGDQDAAMAALQAAEAEASGYMEYLGLEPTLDPVRTHPEFPELLRAMALEDFSPEAGSRERPAA